MSHDPNSTPTNDFPNLTPTNHRVIGPETREYNCIAWACHDTTRWWSSHPGYYWPYEADEECWVGDLVRVFASLGFSTCENGDLEPGMEKVAIYGLNNVTWTHAARQLPSGKWTSKLGRSVLIEHDTPEDVAGAVYGTLLQFMKRPLPQVDPGRAPTTAS